MSKMVFGNKNYTVEDTNIVVDLDEVQCVFNLHDLISMTESNQ